MPAATKAEGYFVPKGVTYIGPGAFVRLKVSDSEIRLPASENSIATGAFSSSTVTVHCPVGSYTKRWCNEHRIPAENE